MGNTFQHNNWVDKNAYPFKSHYFETEQGRIHYIDEGTGEVILFVHGTPTWSFLYRNYLKELSKTHRCIAIDHLGFGLSDKPVDFPGTPEMHSHNLERFIKSLQLKNINLVVHDFGGPIGLAYAISHPENVSKLILFNTWLWETKHDKDAKKIDKILHSKFGNFIYLYTNFSPAILLKKAIQDKQKLTKKIHLQYKKPFPNKNSRYGLLNIGKSLIGSSDWYQSQWEQIYKIANKPVLVLWGDKDEFIKKHQLQNWKKVLTNKSIHHFNTGHFVQEEAFPQSLAIIKDWLANNKST